MLDKKVITYCIGIGKNRMNERDIPWALIADPEYCWPYGCVNTRFVPAASDLEVRAALITPVAEDWTAIRTTCPIPPEKLAEYRLRPLRESLAAMLIDLCNALGTPVELVRYEGVHIFVAVLHRSAKVKGQWQLSFFDEKGPFSDWTEQDPIRMVWDAYVIGYREYAPGTLDAMSRSFDADLLRKITA